MGDVQSKPGRRRLLTVLTAGGAAALAGKTFPRKWTKPVVDSVILPLHAQASTGPTFPILLDGSLEVPPVQTGASGSGTLVFDLTANTVTVNITHTVAMVTAAHIHRAAPGVNGPIIVNFGGGTSPITGTFSVPPGEIASVLAGNTYVNVHSTTNPSGEIRGQIV